MPYFLMGSISVFIGMVIDGDEIRHRLVDDHCVEYRVDKYGGRPQVYVTGTCNINSVAQYLNIKKE